MDQNVMQAHKYSTLNSGLISGWDIFISNCFLESPNWSDRKGNDKVSKCKLKKYLFGNKTKESVTLFATLGLLLIVL